MALDDRLFYFLLGVGVGFVLSRIVQSLRDIKEELDDVDDIVRKTSNMPPRDEEGGFMRYPLSRDIAVLVVVLVTVWASFVSQKASNDVKQAQENISRTTFCSRIILSETINALSERTKYSTGQADANIDLQTAQAQFFDLLLHKPPYSDARKSRAAFQYHQNQQHFLSLTKKLRVKLRNYPVPTPEEFNRCLYGNRLKGSSE